MNPRNSRHSIDRHADCRVRPQPGPVPAPRGLIVGLLLLVVAALILVASGYFWLMRWTATPLLINDAVTVQLQAGQSFSGFANELAEQGLVKDPDLLSWYARLTGQARQAQAGEYLLNPGATPETLLALLRSGQVATYEVQLIEGWTVLQALGALRAHPALEQTLDNTDETTLLSVLGLPPGFAEGMFFPDTYQFVRGDTDADILRRAYQKLQSVLALGWETRSAGLPYETPYEALIVGSLIEKETGRDADREIISQVFVSRLQKGMRLQTDPSVIYGVGAAFRGDLTRAHLRTDTPYNTYTRHGLPPSPIALVGARSLEAALHPAEGDYLYFVSRGDGSSQFSVSLEEHNAAVRRYQLQ